VNCTPAINLPAARVKLQKTPAGSRHVGYGFQERGVHEWFQHLTDIEKPNTPTPFVKLKKSPREPPREGNTRGIASRLTANVRTGDHSEAITFSDTTGHFSETGRVAAQVGPRSVLLALYSTVAVHYAAVVGTIAESLSYLTWNREFGGGTGQPTPFLLNGCSRSDTPSVLVLDPRPEQFRLQLTTAQV
jgi:hypothetical protein